MFLRHVETPSVCLFWCLSNVPFCVLSFILWILRLRMRKWLLLLSELMILCCIKTQENWLIALNKLRNQFRIYQICKVSPFEKKKRIGNIKCLVVFDRSRFSITFFCQISKTYQHIVPIISLLVFVLRSRCNIDFSIEISVYKIQTWQLDENGAYQNCFSKR